MAFLGICVFLLIAWVLSENRAAFRWRWVVAGIGIQFIFAAVMLRWPQFRFFFDSLNSLALSIQTATKVGSTFMFGYLGGGDLPFLETSPGKSFILAFQVLPIVLVMSAISSVLYHWRILQLLIRGISFVLQKTFRADPVMALGVAAGVFLGVIETPLLIKPMLKNLSRSGLFVLFTNCMGSIAGTVLVLYSSILNQQVPDAAGHLAIASLMSAPVTLLFGLLMMPPNENADLCPVDLDLTPKTSSVFEAIVDGTQDGLQMVLGIVATIVVLFSLVALTNNVLGLVPLWGDYHLSLQGILGLIYTPLCYLTGIPWAEAGAAGQLMATKTVLNEFVAYMDMAKLDNLSVSTRLIMTYNMAGFANFASVGILVGSLGLFMPSRKSEILQLALRALISGTLATLTMGATVGILAG